VDEHHPDVRAPGQRSGEQVELDSATDETVVPGRAETTGEPVARGFSRGCVNRPALGSHHAVRLGPPPGGVEVFADGVTAVRGPPR
jgi:hypothetical protein